MKLSKKGLYALEALTALTKNYQQCPTRVHDIAQSEGIPEKFLEGILNELKMLRVVESTRGTHGGYLLRRDPSKVFLGDVIRNIDGPLAPMGDAETLRRLIKTDKKHSALYRVFLDVRDSAADILDNTSLADLARSRPRHRV